MVVEEDLQESNTFLMDVQNLAVELSEKWQLCCLKKKKNQNRSKDDRNHTIWMTEAGDGGVHVSLAAFMMGRRELSPREE